MHFQLRPYRLSLPTTFYTNTSTSTIPQQCSPSIIIPAAHHFNNYILTTSHHHIITSTSSVAATLQLVSGHRKLRQVDSNSSDLPFMQLQLTIISTITTASHTLSNPITRNSCNYTLVKVSFDVTRCCEM